MGNRMRTCGVILTTFSILILSLVNPGKTMAWGEYGHKISGKAAALKLPNEMPAFFRKALEQLSYLNPEPDRWRDKKEASLDPALNTAAAAEHYVHLELMPAEAVNAQDRYDYLKILNKAGISVSDAGLLQYRTLELFQQVRIEFRLWRAADAKHDTQTKKWIEERIINDAGILGHYVTDGSNPHHTTIHTTGWVGPNPKDYATDKEFHGRFEKDYVDSHIKLEDILPRVNNSPRILSNLRLGIMQYLEHSHSLVEKLYELDKRAAYNNRTTEPENKQFTIERLAAGAEMLRDLWWTAWITSGTS